MADPDTPDRIESLPQDGRFRATAWRRWPYDLIYREVAIVLSIAAAEIAG